MVRLDYRHDAFDSQRAEGLPHDGANRFGSETTSPGPRVKVISEFDLGTAML